MEWIDLRNRLGDDLHCAAILQMLERVNLQSMFGAYRPGGKKPYQPDLMLAIALVEILAGRSSPSKWHANANTRDQCRYVGQGIAPARSTWYEFRDRCDKFIHDIADQIVGAAIEDEIIEPDTGSLDGTTSRAAATRHRLLNHGQVERRIEKLNGAIGLLDADLVSELAPDALKELRKTHEIPNWVGPTRKGRQRQLKQFEKAESVLADRIKANAKRPKKYQSDPAKLTISPWDVDAVIGRDKEKVLCPLYNTQYMVASDSDVIMAYAVFAQCTDSGTLVPMIERTQEVVQNLLRVVLADAGYCSLLDLIDCRERNIELYAPVAGANADSSHKAADGKPQLSQKEFTFYPDEDRCVCPAGHEMTRRARGTKPRADGRTVTEIRYEQSIKRCGSCSMAGRCLRAGSSHRSVARMEGQEILDAQIVKMSTDQGKAFAKLRGQSVERLFADGKLHRNQNQQNGRGIDRVRAEVGLLVVAQNALRTYNLRNALKKPET